jgi:hypothetical protein
VLLDIWHRWNDRIRSIRAQTIGSCRAAAVAAAVAVATALQESQPHNQLCVLKACMHIRRHGNLFLLQCFLPLFYRCCPHVSSLAAGISNGSYGRPAAVQLQAVAAGDAAAAGSAQVIAVPPGESAALPAARAAQFSSSLTMWSNPLPTPTALQRYSRCEIDLRWAYAAPVILQQIP